MLVQIAACTCVRNIAKGTGPAFTKYANALVTPLLGMMLIISLESYFHALLCSRLGLWVKIRVRIPLQPIWLLKPCMYSLLSSRFWLGIPYTCTLLYSRFCFWYSCCAQSALSRPWSEPWATTINGPHRRSR